jgi:hypothetical protein
MSERLVDRIPFAKIFTVLAIVFGISLGLCGVTFAISSGGDRGGGFLIGLGILELIAGAVSAAGLVLTLLLLVTLSMFGIVSGKVSQPQKLFEEEDHTTIDKNE